MTPEQLAVLRKLAKDRDFGRGQKHAYQVDKLAKLIYDGLTACGLLNAAEKDRTMLEAAALLHDIGLPREPHNEAAFDFLAGTLPCLLAGSPIEAEEMSTLLYCILWHRGSSFLKRGAIAIANPEYTEKMAAIMRVADALDRTLQQLVEDLDLCLGDRCLVFTVFSKHSIGIEINRAIEKSDLMKRAFNLTGGGNSSMQNHKKKVVLLVCGGNTCRSPMAKVILEEKLKTAGALAGFEIDSAAYDSPTLPGASENARTAIEMLFGKDLLVGHRAKKLTSELAKRLALADRSLTPPEQTLSTGILLYLWTNEVLGRIGEVTVYRGEGRFHDGTAWVRFHNEAQEHTNLVFRTENKNNNESMSKEAARIADWAIKNIRQREVGLLVGMKDEVTRMKEATSTLEAALNPLVLRPLILGTKCDICPV